MQDNLALKILFWLLTAFAVLLAISYTGSLIISTMLIFDKPDISRFAGAAVGLLALIAQVAVIIKSVRGVHSNLPETPAKIFLTLAGGSLLIGFIWFGGCVLTLSNFRIAG